ncbi:MAG TPA: serine/threonine protein kinase, partial [Polyangiaceae bacterium]|nr:serine/threonine protein kinase [Polyangiaceae bacterium]
MPRAWRTMRHFMELQPGDTIPGPIELERVIYRRKSGVIWRASHAKHGSVSVKVPSAEALFDDDELAERFRLESRATVEINSEHVVRVLEDGLIDGAVPFVVMEALDGEPLRARLERDGPLSLEDADRVVEQAAAGLSAAHAVGIVHRDINPETVFLHKRADGRPTVKVVDFGVAKIIGGKL